MEVILIPVKRLGEAKQRLAARLSPPDRGRLGLAMLADVLRATDKWPERWIITSDPDAEAVGLAFGCRLVNDEGLDLNEALARGLRIARAEGASAALVLPADVPLVTADDVSALFVLDAPIVISVSETGGTNALVLRPPDAIAPSFGDGSAARHAAAAKDKGIEAVTVRASSLLLDVDDPAGLATLASADSDRESVRLARSFLQETPEWPSA